MTKSALMAAVTVTSTFVVLSTLLCTGAMSGCAIDAHLLDDKNSCSTTSDCLSGRRCLLSRCVLEDALGPPPAIRDPFFVVSGLTPPLAPGATGQAYLHQAFVDRPLLETSLAHEIFLEYGSTPEYGGRVPLRFDAEHMRLFTDTPLVGLRFGACFYRIVVVAEDGQRGEHQSSFYVGDVADRIGEPTFAFTPYTSDVDVQLVRASSNKALWEQSFAPAPSLSYIEYGTTTAYGTRRMLRYDVRDLTVATDGTPTPFVPGVLFYRIVAVDFEGQTAERVGTVMVPARAKPKLIVEEEDLPTSGAPRTPACDDRLQTRVDTNSGESASGTVHSSGSFTANQPAWFVFDDDAERETLWMSELGETPAWVGYEWVDHPRTISHYVLVSANGPPLNPTRWTLDGWNGEAWISVDSRSGETNWIDSPTRKYTVMTPGPYAAYRLNVLDDDNERDGVQVIALSLFELWGCVHAGDHVGAPPSW